MSALLKLSRRCIQLERPGKQLFRGYASKSEKTFDKILIANRGEIACRVMRTCKEMGIKTVAIYSDADAQSVHVRMADEAVRIGPPVATESYLNMDAVVDAIEKSGAQAVHPGYGFLSEKSVFAAALEKRNVAFIGPSSKALSVMGDKIESKRAAHKAKVNTIPGHDGVVKNVEEAIKLAKEIGYPVMLKASAGGGGKGMRISYDDQQTREGFYLATEEAKTAVKDDRLLIEKYIEKPRHIEIQLLGDKLGNVIYLNERECSVQRRNQKVVEEAPSTFLDPATRRAMGEQAVSLAKLVNYTSAGTCEFLVDPHRNFYFLEMNTRLQVEHPVTECTTGVDIVREMIRVAAGLPLSYKQQDIGIKGWAVESRVYAEDPVRFLPSTGYLSTYIEPKGKKGLENVRIDTGIVEGSTISMYYDPMISKLITYGETRNEALATMKKALDNYCIRGVNHNIPILREIITNPRFIAGDISTYFLKEEYPDGFKGHVLTPTEKDELVTAAAFMHIQREELNTSFLNQERLSSDLDPMPTTSKLVICIGKDKFDVGTSWDEDGFTVTMEDGRKMKLKTDWCVGEPLMVAELNGQEISVQYDSRRGRRLFLRYCGNKYDVLVQDVRSAELMKYIPEKTALAEGNVIKAPMPGLVKMIACKEGDSVEAGTTVVILEAMKMQNPLFAPVTGVVKAIHYQKNDSVSEDDVIMEFVPEANNNK